MHPGRSRVLVVWQGMRLAIIGVVLGTGAALGLTRFLASFLFGVNPLEPLAAGVFTMLLELVCCFVWRSHSSWWIGRRTEELQSRR